MADKRAYFKLDVGYLTNPKVLSILDESPTAVLLHIGSIGYAAQHLTDGIVPIKALLRSTGATEVDAELLLAAGLWVDGPTGGKAEVHDYLEHQRSSTEVKGASEKAKRAASRRWDASSNAVSNASSMPDAMPDASESAMPREKREREEREKINAADAAAPTTGASLDIVTTAPDVERICNHLADAIETNGSKRPNIGKSWHTSARLMLDKDKRTEQEIHGAIDWCQADPFWRGVILSLPKLREKFDTLRLQAQRQKSVPRPGGIDWDAAADRARALDALRGADQ
jgi:hypothetical protein